jgi:hypothetical protein
MRTAIGFIEVALPCLLTIALCPASMAEPPAQADAKVTKVAKVAKVAKRTFVPHFEDLTFAVGDVEKYEFHMVQTTRQEVIRPEGEPLHKTVRLEARGKATVRLLEILEKKHARKALVTFNTIEHRQNEDDFFRSMPCQGEEIELVLWPELRITRTDGVELTSIEQKILAMMFNKTDPDAPTPDAMYAPKASVEIGETWSIDAERFQVAAQRSAPPGVSLSSVSGQMSLVKVVRAKGREFLKVQGKADATLDSTNSAGDVGGEVTFYFGSELPLDGKGSRNTTTTRQVLEVVASRDGTTLRINVDSSRSFHTIWPSAPTEPLKTSKSNPTDSKAMPKSEKAEKKR